MFLLIVALMIAQLACGGLLPGRSGGDGTSTGGGAARPGPHFKPGFNLFSPEQDVELGRRSASEIAQQVPLMRDEATVNYVRQLGAKLAGKASGEKFPYQFNVVGTRDVNAFALPGGFIFVYAGAIASAKNEGELAGVIAHEITHVALRHGTNQASKAYLAKAGLGVLGALAGSGDSPDISRVVESIGGAGANMILLRFGRTAETQADLEGARIMAEAGYDPRDMAGFFQTLQAGGGQRVPEFLSDHPDPGNRVAAISAALLSLPMSANPVRDTDAFQQIKARLTGRAAPLTSAREPARKGPRDPSDIEPTTRPQPPAPSFRGFQARDNSFAFQYPQNWDALTTGNDENLIFAPPGAYGQKGEAIFVTHGVFVGTLPAPSSNLEQANRIFVEEQIKINLDFRVERPPQRINFGGREGYTTVVAGPSTVTGVTEIDVIYITADADGKLFYLITMAPEDEFGNYGRAFEQMISSLRLAG